MARKKKLADQDMDQFKSGAGNVQELVSEDAKEAVPVETSDESLIAVTIDMIPSQVPLPCSVYVKVAGKFVLFRNQGEKLSMQRVMELQGRSVAALYIHKAFWNMFMKTLEQLELECKDDNQKAEHVRHLLVAYGQELEKQYKQPKKPAFDRMRKMCDRIAELTLKDRKVGLGLLKRNTDPVLYFVNHSVNVAVFSTLIGIKLKLSLPQLKQLTFGSLVHDVGNLFLPKRILYKTEEKTEEEELEMRSHARRGAELLQQVGAPPFVVLMALQHHERWDGEGYPSNLREEEIHQFARICAISDTFDELTSKRPDSDPVSTEEALEIMRKADGQFDPKLLDSLAETQIPEGEPEEKDESSKAA
jgi:HD-GYP domain-containing protein (c-di-GMP phosphodiesterase class II)